MTVKIFKFPANKIENFKDYYNGKLVEIEEKWKFPTFLRNTLTFPKFLIFLVFSPFSLKTNTLIKKSTKKSSLPPATSPWQHVSFFYPTRNIKKDCFLKTRISFNNFCWVAEKKMVKNI